MAAQFGTSGLRGLVLDLTEAVVKDHTRAFLSCCDTGDRIWIGQDLRASSPLIADWVAQAVAAAGRDAIHAGVLPTPALALAARGQGAVMVTGSHIPADRNGLKFYTRQGEIAKTDEAAITAALGRPAAPCPPGRILRDTDAGPAFLHRYTDAFGPRALAGRRIGVYSHSAAGRDLLLAVMAGLGAEVLELARSETFVPVDTEAVDPATRARLAAWVADHRLDAIVSTDGDSDRPMLVDETGAVVPGDLLGQIAAGFLGADTVVTPVSSNTGLEAGGRFARTLRTRIGSPHVIAGMEAMGGRAAGYEANGGFLLGFAARGPTGDLAPLPTRDSFLPLIAVLADCEEGPVSARVRQEPARFTASDRLADMPEGAMRALVADLAANAEARAAFLDACATGPEAATDLTDGVRITAMDGRILHVRPSGNAPELRLYTEAETPEAARAMLERGLAVLAGRLHPGR